MDSWQQASPLMGRLEDQATPDSYATRANSDGDDDDDLLSVSLLQHLKQEPLSLADSNVSTAAAASSSARTRANEVQGDTEVENLDHSPPITPATQTLNMLSQSTNLRYNMAHLQEDVAAATLVNLLNNNSNTPPETPETDTTAVVSASATAAVAASRMTAAYTNINNMLQEESSGSETEDPDDASPQKRAAVSTLRPNNATTTNNNTTTTAASKGKNKSKSKSPVGTAKSAPVHQVDVVSGKIVATFDSIRKAHLQTGVGRQRIAEALDQDSKVVEGYLWRRVFKATGNNKIIPKKAIGKAATVKAAPVASTKNDKKKPTYRKPVQQLHTVTGEVIATFDSILKASNAAGIKRGHLYRALNEGTTEGGFKWKHAESTSNEAPSVVPVAAKSKTAVPKDDHNIKNAAPAETNKVATVPAAPSAKINTADDAMSKEDTPAHSNATVAAVPAAKSKTTDDEMSKEDTPVHSNNTVPLTKSVRILGGYSIHYVTVHAAGPIGLAIHTDKPPAELCRLLECIDRAKEKFCRIELIHSPSSAGDAGLQAGDWFLSTAETNAVPVLQDLNAVATVARQVARPLTFAVARKTIAASSVAPKKVEAKAFLRATDWECSSDDDQQGKDATSHRLENEYETNQEKQASTDVATVESRPSVARPNADVPKSDMVSDAVDSDKVPFCALCNGRKPLRPVHHAWCPKHGSFDASGANRVLERIQQGVQMNCQVCVQELSQGRICKGEAHSKDCQRNQKILEALHAAEDSPPPSPIKKNKKKRKTHGSPKDKSSRSSENRPNNPESSLPTTVRGRKIRITDKFRESEANLSDVGGDEDSDSSAYEGTKVVARRPLGGLLGAKKASKANSQKGYKKSKPSGKAVGRDANATSGKTNEAVSKRAAKKRTRTSLVADLNSASRRASEAAPRYRRPMQDSEEEVDDNTDGPIDVAWMQCGDPWGLQGHHDDDVVLFAPSKGLGHHETALPSSRYETDPFSDAKRYRQTHRTPEEGFQALVLKRDTLGIRPWGFECQRHEFGGACLVSSVEPLSPADAATYLGATSDTSVDARLRVNDMVVAINGKRVGGMTESGVDIELETSGPEFVLLVSRYKYAGKVQNRVQAAERSYLDAMDQVVNDERLLGWTDLGAPAVTTAEAPVEMDTADGSPERTAKPRVSPLTTIADEAIGLSSADSVEVHKVGETNRPRSRSDPSLLDHTDEIETNRDNCLQQAKKPDPLTDDPIPVDSDQAQESEVYTGVAKADPVEDVQASSLLQGSVEALDEHSNSDKEADTEWDDDGNAWHGCVCGEIHGKEVPVFWIQCETCQSWYNVSEVCADLDAKEAENVERWICWGCPVPEDDDLPREDVSTVEAGPARDSALELMNVDLPAATNKDTTCTDAETGDTAGKRVADEGFVHPKTKTRLKEDGTYARPRGRIRSGYQWDAELGVWVPKKSNRKASPSKAPVKKPGQPPAVSFQPSRSVSKGAPLSKAKPAEDADDHGDASPSPKKKHLPHPAGGYDKGTIVIIEEHGWSGVNNPEGIAEVLNCSVDEDGDLIYDVKYIVGGRARGVLAEFIGHHKFYIAPSEDS